MPIRRGAPGELPRLPLRCTPQRLCAIWLAAAGLLLLVSCSYLPSLSREDPPPPFVLLLSLDKPVYLPGEPVLARVELKRPLGAEMAPAMQPDHETVRFMVRPDRDGGEREITFAEPVYSPQEPTKQRVELAAGAGIPRRFLFTVLTFDRGSFALAAEYVTPDPQNPSLPLKTYSPPAAFKVQGDKVFARRYSNGLLHREDALDLARKQVQGEVLDAKGIWAVDEKGFLKWWVNVQCREADKKEVVRSFLIDPYLVRVEAAPKPFEKKEEDLAPPFPRDSRRIQDLREKRRIGTEGKQAK